MGIRTPGLVIANDALYQLSYTPGSAKAIIRGRQDLSSEQLSWDCFHSPAGYKANMAIAAANITSVVRATTTCESNELGWLDMSLRSQAT